jgi:hypothetical protein
MTFEEEFREFASKKKQAAKRFRELTGIEIDDGVKITKDDLKYIMESLGLSSSGEKKDMIKRLIENIDELHISDFAVSEHGSLNFKKDSLVKVVDELEKRNYNQV